MSAIDDAVGSSRDFDRRAETLFHEQRDRLIKNTDRMFAVLMALQWIAAIVAAVVVSPHTWAGSIPSVHVHVWSALIVGGSLSGFPIFLALRLPGLRSTRYTIAAAQMLWSGLLIHLTGGRIETHFHVFGSLAFLAMYRDWRVLVPATLVVAIDHAIRGIFWPQSVYGVLSASPWRTAEHAAWVIFENIFLIRACRKSVRETWDIARNRAQLEKANELIEAKVKRRTAQLDESLALQRSIVDGAAEGIITIDTSGTILSYNSSARRMFGHEEWEAIGSNISRLAAAPFDAEHDSYLRRYIETGEKKILGTRRVVDARRKDGSTFPLELSVSELSRGGTRVFTGICRDITEARRAQEKLDKLNSDLRKASRQAGMAEVATGVLHNVGNVLNSVNVSASVVAEKLRQSKVSGVGKAAALLSDHAGDLEMFLTEDEKGRRLPDYLTMLADHLANEQAETIEELHSLTENVEHIKAIVSMQQSYAGMSGLVEPVNLSDTLDDVLKLNGASYERHGVVVAREYEEIQPVTVDKHKLMQILVNLVRNAGDALAEIEDQKRLTVRVRRLDGTGVRLDVMDNGPGIAESDLTRIFAHGFTTKKNGHGFGLHSAALAAKEMGGSLTVRSDGPGRGAIFTLELPLKPAEVSA